MGDEEGARNMSMWTAVSDLIMERVDDLVYAELLALSLILSLLMRLVSQGIFREIFGAMFGIWMVYYFTGWKLLYSLIAVVANIFLHMFVKNRYLPLCSFIFTFVYLGFLRAIHLFNLPPLVSHANAVQLIMTLRLVGLSFEIEDSRRKNELKYDCNRTRFIVEPTWWETFFYAYNFSGLFTGPYYTYAMHRDVINNDSVMDIPVWSHIKWRIYNLIWAFPAFTLLVYVFPLEKMREEQFFDETVFYRIWVSMLVFFWMRCRVYSAWMVAESICVLNGIGMYPEESCPRAGEGPTKLKEYREQMNIKGTKYSSEAVRNLDIWAIEFMPSFRGGIRAWNRSVQFWLANFIYKRVPRAFGMILTMSVSAYWHGIHPGYYFSFLTVPLCTLAEDMILSVVPKDEQGNRPLLFVVFWYIARQLGFALMASGFLLLTYKDTLRYWNSVHFHVHWIMGTVIVFAWLYKTMHYTGLSQKRSFAEQEGHISVADSSSNNVKQNEHSEGIIKSNKKDD